MLVTLYIFQTCFLLYPQWTVVTAKVASLGCLAHSSHGDCQVYYCDMCWTKWPGGTSKEKPQHHFGMGNRCILGKFK
jgi:hypothetical protein